MIKIKSSSRRTFIRKSSLAAAAFVIPATLLAKDKKKKHNLSFSTLGCPKWSLQTIVDFAAKNSYNGVEIRTIQGELDLTKCPDFSTANITTTKRLFADKALIITDLGASTELHHTEAATRKKHLDEGKAFIDLASKLGSPYIRIFPNKLPTDDTRKAAMDLIASGLSELSTYAKGSGVKVLMETHGDLVKADEILSVMQTADAENAGLVWDIFNMWSITKELPEAVFVQLKNYIKHVHVKDGIIKDGKEQYVLLGRGEGPIKEAVQLLHQSNYKGFYSFEWEKMWHPELEEPKVALADYSLVMKKYLD